MDVLSNHLEIVMQAISDYDGSVDIQEDRLDQLLKQYEMSPLPNLVQEPSAWQEKIDQFYQAWVEPIFDWLRSWFQGLNKINNQYQLPWKWIILAVLCGLLLLGLFFLVRYFLRKKQGYVRQVGNDDRPLTKQGLYEDYLRAEKKGDYALAARLYWKYFLQEKNINSSKTPMEYFGPKREVDAIYTLMFSFPAQHKDFEQFKDVLTQGGYEK